MATPVAPQFVRLLLHAVTTVPAPPRVNAVAPLASLETTVVSATPIIMDLHVNSALPLPAITMVHATLTMVHAYVPLGTRVLPAINVYKVALVLSASLVLVAVHHAMETAFVATASAVKELALAMLDMLVMLASSPTLCCAMVTALQMPLALVLALLAGNHPTVLAVLMITMVLRAPTAMPTTHATAKVLAVPRARVCALLVVLVVRAMHAILIVSIIPIVCSVRLLRLATVKVLATASVSACAIAILTTVSLAPAATSALPTFMALRALHAPRPQEAMFAMVNTALAVMESAVMEPALALLLIPALFATILSLPM